VPLLIEPVSVEKTRKLRKVLDGSGRWTIDYITPSKDELESILQTEIDDDPDLDLDIDIVRAVDELKGKGVKNIIITLGERGIYVSCGGDDEGRKEDWHKFMAPYRGEVVDVTGAGDALVAGLVYGVYKSGGKIWPGGCGFDYFHKRGCEERFKRRIIEKQDRRGERERKVIII
jgi:pseudouridine kinase